mmetsp:Transcript_64406/g.141223  ORF Transcript_64406/g.141223 Transcript_64406/m.141223 type:complete len:87 (-) Transcript_64406:1442-1702(-)
MGQQNARLQVAHTTNLMLSMQGSSAAAALAPPADGSSRHQGDPRQNPLFQLAGRWHVDHSAHAKMVIQDMPFFHFSEDPGMQEPGS